MSTADDTDFSGPVWSRGEPRIAGATHVGVVRKVNQDAFGRFDDLERGEILLVVADGLGGHRGGKIASKMAVSLVGDLVLSSGEEPTTRLRQSIIRANDDILKAGRNDQALDGMGTTIVCLLFSEDGQSYVAHVGDSRLYRIRPGRIESLTEDHSLVATLVREGVLSIEEARLDRRRNQILRALGVREDTEVDITAIELQPGDVYLLCSDGLHGMLTDEEILEIASRQIRPAAVVEQLIEAANQAGGTDNVTCLLAQVPEPMPVDTFRTIASRLFQSALSFLTGRLNSPPRSEGETTKRSDPVEETYAKTLSRFASQA